MKCNYCKHDISSKNDINGECRKCKGLEEAEVGHISVSSGEEEQHITPPNLSPHVLYFHHGCFNKWKGSDHEKNYDIRRLKALDEYLEKCRNGYKWSGGEPEEGYFVKRSSDEVYDFEKAEEIYIEEAKKIRQKWNIKDSPQEREREREREQNYPTEIWNSAIRTNC